MLVLLPQNHRQASDSNLYSILSRLRVGKQTDEDIQVLNNTSTLDSDRPGTHLRLVVTNRQADDINRAKLSQISSEPISLEACDTVLAELYITRLRLEVRNRLENATPNVLVSKVGARVENITHFLSFVNHSALFVKVRILPRPNFSSRLLRFQSIIVTASCWHFENKYQWSRRTR